MITLKTLPQATAQEVFDQVKNHLLAQNKKCKTYTCFYRFENLKCAAGCLIGDDEYKHEMEGNNWGALVGDGIVPKNHDNLIRSLQDVHDLVVTEEWPNKLKEVAEAYHLKYE